jgi:RNA polymerase sigma-B factor
MTTSPLDDRRHDEGALGRAVDEALRPTEVRRLSDAQRSERTAALLTRAHHPDTSEAERSRCLDRVVELNMRVAEAVARRYARRGVPVEDLTQVAYLALLRAVRSFDPAHERDLLAYAVPSMTGEIRRHFRDHSWTIRPPREVQRAHGRLIRSGAPLDRVDEASVSALAAEVEESVEVVREALAARSCFSLLSLDTPATGEHEDSSALREVPDTGVEDDVARSEARLLVRPLLAGLGVRDRDLLHLRFTEELSQREIALRLGMSQVQVSRCLQRLLLQLRGALAETS